MKNITQKTTDENRNKEANQIKLGKVDIYEPADNRAENVSVQLHIPYRFYLCGRRSLSEYERISLEDLRIKASTFFELVEFLSSLLREGDGNAMAINEFINLAGVFGKGLIDTTETIEMDFNRHRKAANEKPIGAPAPEAERQTERPKAKTLDEDTLQVIGENSDEESDGDLRSLASQIASMMKNDAMPTQLFNVMADELPHIPRDWRTPESVLFSLKEMKKAEGKND